MRRRSTCCSRSRRTTDGSQVGAVAFERIGTTLRFLGGTEVTDYMGPVALPDAQEAMARALWAGLTQRDDWTDADLRGLPRIAPGSVCSARRRPITV